MDYNSTKKHTQKWQWELMRKSNLLKIFLLWFALSFFSCSGLKDKNYQKLNNEILKNVSCKINDSITNEDKILDISKTYPIKYNNTEIYFRKKNSHIFFDEENYDHYIKRIYYPEKNYIKNIVYDISGKVKKVYSTISDFTFIGRGFMFDETGNIIKIIEYNPKICAFQAIAIAQKSVNDNVNKENPNWNISKVLKSVWEVSYRNKKNKTSTLYINANNGKIIKQREILPLLDVIYTEKRL